MTENSTEIPKLFVNAIFKFRLLCIYSCISAYYTEIYVRILHIYLNKDRILPWNIFTAVCVPIEYHTGLCVTILSKYMSASAIYCSDTWKLGSWNSRWIVS